ncbi:conserved hypothetical protein [Candidatus Terasakiella magnetica]|uniref:DUF2007 domain-containing protein n=1 Tax=Candidatus Terasakiella magnetica TaxID=1867952 RepID=A0A1C3RHW9_9PROT|nr:DUF2007 domain-containing protein [Candidatus Terasakiella magnetica]SCA56879.1 conserved hypothetical protein [Candidatus Terasakiella magnetica]
MKELVASGDPVLLSALKYHLEGEGIEYDLFDGFVGSLFPGDFSVASSRIMVSDEDYDRAKRLLKSLQNGEMACE